jgi:hypothetical protein
MEFNEIKDIILSYDDLLSWEMKKYMHYRSIRNFVDHFDEIKGVKAQLSVCNLLSGYIEDAQMNDFDFSDRIKCRQLVRKYLWPLADYYKEDSKFMGRLSLQFVLVVGLILDGILYFTGLSSRIFYIPIVTIALLSYYLFIVIFKEPRGRVYGFRY